MRRWWRSFKYAFCELERVFVFAGKRPRRISGINYMLHHFELSETIRVKAIPMLPSGLKHRTQRASLSHIPDLKYRVLQMVLSDRIHTYGQHLLRRYGERVHKIALDAGLTCPNRDGSKGIGGCTFCNNDSFSPNGRTPPTLHEQLESGRRAIRRRTRATKFIAYFQAYTNTYAKVEQLRAMYEEVLKEPDVIGLSIGTRPDCVPPEVLDLLDEFRERGLEVVLELGLQSAFDETLRRVNRGHGLAGICRHGHCGTQARHSGLRPPDRRPARRGRSALSCQRSTPCSTSAWTVSSCIRCTS